MTPRPFADAVVVAAGSSVRMGTDKLAESILGWPLLRWAVEAMLGAPEVAATIVVAAPGRVAELEASDWLAGRRVRVLAGGPRRQDSVAVGVRATSSEVVLVHDAARPFLEPDLVARVAAAARAHGAAIPVVPVMDSVKRLEGERVAGAVERAGLARAQTPQAARREILVAAVDALADGDDVFGDEAEMLARRGVEVTAVAGDPANLKVTLPEDLELARRLAAGRSPVRFATGQDSHPFGPEDGLRLGGLEVPEAPRLFGHSDGDAVLHALCDGLLAAAGATDLGRLFPAGDPATSGIDSGELLAVVLERLAERGWRPASADVTILGARPRLGAARLERMRAGLARRLGLELGDVAVKAATGNLQGPEGAGRTISAACLVGIVRR